MLPVFSQPSFQSRQRGSWITAMQMSSASFQSAQLSVAPARESDHGDANEFSQFSVAPIFQSRQRGSQITACRDWRSKNEPEASSLAEGCFFESHIRATNAPARRISIMLILLILSKNSMLIALLRCAPVDSFAPAQLALRAAFGSLSRPFPKVSILSKRKINRD